MSAAGFWTWVVSHLGELRAAAGRDAPVLDDLLEQLHAYCPALYFEIGGIPGGELELIITAEGDERYFDEVRALVAASPTVPGFRAIAFKPAQGFAFVTEHERARIDAARAWFVRLGPGQLRIACAEYRARHHDDFLFAARIVVDTGLGELDGLRVEHVEVGPLPADPVAEGYRPLAELAMA